LKRFRLYFFIGLALLVLVLIKIFFLTPDKAKGANNKGKASVPVNVFVHVISEEKIDNSIFLTGTIKGNEFVTLQPEVSGKVLAVYFTEGQKVAKGQLLVKLNDAELQAQFKKAKAQVVIAREKEVRLQKLLDISAVSREEYDVALNQYQSLQADVDAIQAQLNETEVRAPFSGTIGLRNISVGSIVTPATSIANLVQLNPVKLDFTVPEKYLRAIKNGDRIVFRIEGNPKAFTGKVYAVDPALDEQTRSIKLRAICENNSGELSPGSFAKIELTPGKVESGLLLPTQALVPDLKGQKVYVVKGGKSEVRIVTTGVRTSDKVEITTGLNAGDSVITSGLMQMKPGAAVRVIKNSAP
jgi:membrane fusion protein (multidrug efflux system)